MVLWQGRLCKQSVFILTSFAAMVASSIETSQFSSTAKLGLTLYLALDKSFEELSYFAENEKRLR